MLINYEKLIWLGEYSGSYFDYEDVEKIAVYQINNLAIYLYIDKATDTVLTVEYDFKDQPELLEKDIPRDTADHVFNWLRGEGIIYGEL